MATSLLFAYSFKHEPLRIALKYKTGLGFESGVDCGTKCDRMSLWPAPVHFLYDVHLRVILCYTYYICLAVLNKYEFVHKLATRTSKPGPSRKVDSLSVWTQMQMLPYIASTVHKEVTSMLLVASAQQCRLGTIMRKHRHQQCLQGDVQFVLYL